MTVLAHEPLSATTRTMLSAVVAAPGKVEMRQIPLPQPAAKQFRVRLEGCGVCASNIPPWEGRPWFTYPMKPGALGHEGWGVIDAVGEAVTQFQVGDRVGILSYSAYAQYDLATEETAVRLPKELEGQPFPAEPLGCAVNIFRRCEIRPGQTVAIIGIGFLGALLTRLASHAGANVIAISRRADSRQQARIMGAHEIIAFDDPRSVVERVAAITGGSGGYEVRGFCDCVIECAGTQNALDLAAELCGVRGRLVIAGYHQDGPRQINMQLWNWRGLDVINAHERETAIYLRGMREAVSAVVSGALDPVRLYTHRFPLHQLGEALDLTRERPAGFVKALILFESSEGEVP